MTNEPNVDLDGAEGEDPRSQLWETIADGLASLSEATEAPKGVSVQNSMFSADDVDFGGDGWISRLSDVQGWLNFDSDLPTSGQYDFLTALVTMLGLEPADGLEGAPDGVTQLSVPALERLDTRVEKALELQLAFQQEIDADAANRASASETWSEAWVEFADDSEPFSPEPVSAKSEVWPIYQFVHSRFNLTPSYQRGDVWRGPERQALIESILRGIPLPSIILLRGKGSSPHEVVDGKQRLTTILRFVGAHPNAVEKVDEAERKHPGNNLKSLFTADYPKFRRAWKSVMGEPLTTKLEDEYYFPFKLRNNNNPNDPDTHLKDLRGKYYTEMKSAIIRVSDQEIPVDELFERPVDYKVPVIEYTSATRQQIHEVFRLYNKQGIHLNAEEIRNAVFHDVELTRAILYAAGDSDPRKNVNEISEALVGIQDLDHLGETLSSYRFGDNRYKRTKVLAWMISVLLHNNPGDSLLSTAKHIDDLLSDIQKYKDHKLAQKETLADLFGVIAQAAELHSGHAELWSNKFMDGKNGLKWQELQLVGSLVGMTMAVVGAPDRVEELLEKQAEEIREATKSWERPQKTQTKTQWKYIAQIVTDFLNILGLDMDAVSNELIRRFGSSGCKTLRAALKDQSN